jgi:hypothetical protein
MSLWRHDTQHNDTQHDDIQHNVTLSINDTQQNNALPLTECHCA